MKKTHWIIGIDLGTTNSTLAYTENNEEASPIQQFSIPQMVVPGNEGEESFYPPSSTFPCKKSYRK